MPVASCGWRRLAVVLTQLAIQTKSASTFPFAIAVRGAGLAYTPGRAPSLRTVAHQARAYSTVLDGELL